MNETTHKPAVLLVDDDVELLRALTKVLEKEGFEVIPHADAGNAMRYVNSTGKHFDVVLTDVSMPGMQGIEFLAAVKAAFPSVPVIIITAFGDWGQYMEALHAGAYEYLSKPLDKAQLLATIRRAVADGMKAVHGRTAADVILPVAWRPCYKPAVAMNLTFLLKNCRLFSQLDQSELELIQQMAARKEFRKGQLLFSEGERSLGFFLVVSGAVKIFRVGADGRESVLHVVEANESFAEAALFMEEYPATAEALAATTVIVVDKNGFKQLIARDSKLGFKIMASLVKWLAHMRNAVTDLTLKEVPARFASYVLSLPARPAQPISISISKTTIAQMLAATKETFSRLLHRLAQHRILTYRGNQIRILNRSRLEKIARGDERI